MENEELQALLKKLIESTRLVSSEFKVQKNILPSSVHIPDEIALTFEEFAIQCDRLLREGLISQIQYDKIKNLDLELSEIDDPFFWTLEGLEQDKKWDEIRNKARSALEAFGELELRVPDLSWITHAN